MYCPCVSEYLCLCLSVSMLVGLPQTSFLLQWTDVNGDIYDWSKQWEYVTVGGSFINGAPTSLLQCSERGNGKKSKNQKMDGSDVCIFWAWHSFRAHTFTLPIAASTSLHKNWASTSYQAWTRASQDPPICLWGTMAANGWWREVLCVSVE